MDSSSRSVLESKLRTYCNVEAPEGAQVLKRIIASKSPPSWVPQLKEELAAAIRLQTISPGEYERLTGEDYETIEEVTEELRLLWEVLFVEEPTRG